MFNAMVGFYINTFLVVVDACEGLFLSGRFIQVRTITKHRSTHISSSHDYLQHDFSRDLKNISNYSQVIIMLKIRGVLTSIMDLNI